MPSYQYRAKDRAGNTVTGSLDADSENATADALRQMGLWPMSIDASGQQAAPMQTRPEAGVQTTRTGTAPAAAARHAPVRVDETWKAPAVPVRDLAVYFRQLAAAVHSGMPLGRCLEIMREQSRGTLQRISAEAAEGVTRGQSLSATFGRHSRVFSPLILATVRAGEVGGFLDTSLARIAEMLERQHDLNQRIRRETFMPKLTLAMGVLISIAVKVVMLFVPKEGAAFGATFGNVLVPAIGSVVALYFVAVVLGRLGIHSRILDQVKLSLPLVGKVNRTMALARFSRAFAGLYRAGVSVPEALSTGAQACGNQVVAERLSLALPAVQRGERLSAALEPTQALPIMAMNMLRTGEETGNVDDMLDKVADHSEAEAETAMRAMATMLGPLMVIFIAIFVAIEVGRFFLNYFNTVLNFANG